jgi:hypothetical protein
MRALAYATPPKKTYFYFVFSFLVLGWNQDLIHARQAFYLNYIPAPLHNLSHLPFISTWLTPSFSFWSKLSDIFPYQLRLLFYPLIAFHTFYRVYEVYLYIVICLVSGYSNFTVTSMKIRVGFIIFISVSKTVVAHRRYLNWSDLS